MGRRRLTAWATARPWGEDQAKQKTNRNQAASGVCACCLHQANFLPGLFFHPEDGGDMFLGFHQSTLCYIQQDRTAQSHGCANSPTIKETEHFEEFRMDILDENLHPFIRSSVTLEPFCWILASLSVSKSFTQLVGHLGRGISPSKAATCTQDRTNRINAHTHPCLKCVSNPRSQRSSERRQFMP
jgi:hypothetical protein